MSTNLEIFILLDGMESRELCRQVVGNPPKANPAMVQAVKDFIPRRTEAIRNVIIAKPPGDPYHEVIPEEEIREVSGYLDKLGY